MGRSRRAGTDDLAARTRMSRLLPGDVGSGKTVGALRAMAAVAEGGAPDKIDFRNPDGQSELAVPTLTLLAFLDIRSIAAAHLRLQSQ